MYENLLPFLKQSSTVICTYRNNEVGKTLKLVFNEDIRGLEKIAEKGSPTLYQVLYTDFLLNPFRDEMMISPFPLGR